MSEKPDIVALFENFAAEYDQAYDGTGLRADGARSRLQAALELLGDGPGAVLDAGLGPGRLLEQLQCRGWTGWGIDGSPNMVAHARDRIVQGRLEALPFADETFDAVAAIGVVNYAPEPAVLIGELARVLRPGGRAVMSFGNARCPFRLWREFAVYPVARSLKRRIQAGRPAPPWRNRVLGRRRVSRTLRGAGLEPEAARFSTYTLLPDPLDRLFPRAAARLGRFAGRRGRFVRSLSGLHLIVAARKARP